MIQFVIIDCHVAVDAVIAVSDFALPVAAVFVLSSWLFLLLLLLLSLLLSVVIVAFAGGRGGDSCGYGGFLALVLVLVFVFILVLRVLGALLLHPCACVSIEAYI